MPNMKYCQFHNTLADLRDCFDSMENGDDVSETEWEAQKALISLCCDIALDFGESVGRTISEE